MEKKVVSAEENKILKKMFWNSHLVFANFNMTKMEANGFTMTMAPAVESIYGDDIEGKKAAYARHQSFFNTHAVAFNFIAGLCYALEKDCHDGKVPGETIDAIKASLMGPTAGMFDSIFFNCLRVIGAGIAIGLCSQGNILGTFIFILLYGVHCNKFYALQTVADHAVDCVAAAAAHANDLDRRNIFIHFFVEHECHNFCPPSDMLS